MISQILQRIQLPWLFQQANPGQNVVAVPQQHFAANPLPVNPPAGPQQVIQQQPTLEQLRQERLRIVDHGRLFWRLVACRTSELFNANESGNRFRSAPEDYEQMRSRLFQINKTLALAGGGSRIAVQKRFAELQRESLLTMQQSLRESLGENISNPNYANLKNMVETLGVEIGLHNSVIAAANRNSDFSSSVTHILHILEKNKACGIPTTSDLNGFSGRILTPNQVDGQITALKELQTLTPSLPPLTSSNNILPLSQSGDIRYPALHSVFTNNTQNRLSQEPVPPVSLNIETYLDGLGNNYMSSIYGSPYIRRLAQTIVDNGTWSVPLESHLMSVTNAMARGTNPDPFHTPLFRLGADPTIGSVPEPFEVLVITGTPSDARDALGEQLNVLMLQRSITDTYRRRCRTFQILNNPNRSELIRAIRERAESVRRRGGRLYIMYLGHGIHDGVTGVSPITTNNTFQSGITLANRILEGSRRYVFGLNRVPEGFNEDAFKALLNRYTSDISTGILIHSCFSGAAITATDPFYRALTGVA